jgi:hypothetical protein
MPDTAHQGGSASTPASNRFNTGKPRKPGAGGSRSASPDAGVRVIELDLSGRKLSVTMGDLEWLRVRAARAAGSSSAASELAGRLGAIGIRQRRLVFVRSELRGIYNALVGAGEVPAGLNPLDQLLRQLFASR